MSCVSVDTSILSFKTISLQDSSTLNTFFEHHASAEDWTKRFSEKDSFRTEYHATPTP